MSQMNSVYTVQAHFIMINLILFSHLRFVCQTSSILQSFPQRTMHFPDFKLSLYSEWYILLLGDSPASEFYVPTFRNTVCSIFIALKKEHNNHVFISFPTRATCLALLNCLNLITYYFVKKLFIVPFFYIFVLILSPSLMSSAPYCVYVLS